MKKFFSFIVLLSMVAFTTSAQNSKDVNADGLVDIGDVTSIIDCLLNPSSADSYRFISINGDSIIDVTDVSFLIDFILSAPTSGTIQSFTVNGVTFEMVAVEGGTFTMGATPEQGTYYNNSERPTHQVTVSSFWIGKTEVTQQLWIALMGSNPSYFHSSNLQPVEHVSWNDCQEFITKLNEATGKTFRLPTEAEWEFAARGGNKSQGYKFSGSNNDDDVAWYDSNSGGKTHPVASKAPNELGIYDMSGNLFEWCNDWYNSSYYSSSPKVNPTGPESGTMRVMRGGDWSSAYLQHRVAFRDRWLPDQSNFKWGFRLCLSE